MMCKDQTEHEQSLQVEIFRAADYPSCMNDNSRTVLTMHKTSLEYRCAESMGHCGGSSHNVLMKRLPHQLRLLCYTQFEAESATLASNLNTNLILQAALQPGYCTWWHCTAALPFITRISSCSFNFRQIGRGE